MFFPSERTRFEIHCNLPGPLASLSVAFGYSRLQSVRLGPATKTRVELDSYVFSILVANFFPSHTLPPFLSVTCCLETAKQLQYIHTHARGMSPAKKGPEGLLTGRKGQSAILLSERTQLCVCCYDRGASSVPLAS